MQITDNYQPNFKSVRYGANALTIKKILSKKLPKNEVDSFLKKLEESPVTTTLGLADGNGIDRLDAMVQYKHPILKNEIFEYFEEGKFFNLLGLKPRSFINKILMKINSIEETFEVGKYAK